MAKKTFKDVFLVGRRIYFRPLTKSDINERYLSWLNDSEVTKYIEAGHFPTTKDDLDEFYKIISKSKTDIIFAIIYKNKDLHIGNIELGRINWIHRFADIGIMIGDKNYWGKGYGQEACQLLLDYAFNKLNLHKIIVGVYSTHKSAIRTYQKVGFEIEGRITKFLNLDGKYVDKIILGISKRKFVISRLSRMRKKE